MERYDGEKMTGLNGFARIAKNAAMDSWKNSFRKGMKKYYNVKLHMKRNHDFNKPVPKRHFPVNVGPYIPEEVARCMNRNNGTVFLLEQLGEEDPDALIEQKVMSLFYEYKKANGEKEDLMSLTTAGIETVYECETSDDEEESDDEEDKATTTPRMSGRKTQSGVYSSTKRAAVSVMMCVRVIQIC